MNPKESIESRDKVGAEGQKRATGRVNNLPHEGQQALTATGKMHNVSPHGLRDAFAVHAVKLDDSGDGLRMLQEHLGHQSISTTMGYRKVAGGELRTWYKKLWEEEEGG